MRLHTKEPSRLYTVVCRKFVRLFGTQGGIVLLADITEGKVSEHKNSIFTKIH